MSRAFEPPAFADIFPSKQRLEIQVVEAPCLLTRIREIKLAARDDVINVPDGSVVFPSHPFLELAFQVGDQFGHRATKKR